jgi:CubicO group peptidase (beta-lactamase class C family)
MKRCLYVLIVSLSVLLQIPAQNRNGDLKNYLEKAEAYGFSGQILVAEKGKILLNKAYGSADRERKISNKLDTVFNVASFTKQFTAAAILRLEADGKLKTADTIGKYFDNVPADKAGITVHQLLSHTSGLTRGNSTKNTTRDESVQKIFGEPLAAKPGEKFIYSNNGFHLLAAMIEKLSGQTYRQYITEKLFQPAGMKDSGFFSDTKWPSERIARTHNEWSKLDAFTDWKKVWNYGSGSIVSDTEDIFRWFQALNANKIIPKEEKEKLFQKYTASFDEDTSYGYGWYIEKLKDGSDLIFHGGDNPGYHSEFRWYVKDDRVIIILANYEIFEPDGTAVQKRIIANTSTAF